MIYTGYMRPYETRLANNLELVNETFIILCSYFLIIFSAFLSDAEVRYKSGWVLIGLVAILLALNMAVIVFRFISHIIRCCRLRIIRHRNLLIR